MTPTSDIVRPPAEWVRALQAIGAATCSSTLYFMGVRDTFIQGPVAWSKGRAIAGPALTLQFMPLRQDLYGEGEYADPEKQLHRHVLYHTRPGDIVVVDARGDMRSGIFGEMMLTYFKGRGGAGVVIDGCIRDYPHCKSLDLGLWIGGVTVVPGDIIVADDDGATVVPVALAQEVIEKASEHHDWEEFSRLKLAEGGALQRYYPLSEEARPEYEAWRRANRAGSLK